MAKAEEVDLMLQMAQMYYLEGLTRVEIAKRLNTSRFKVARTLEAALETGLVTITIRPPELVDGDLSAEVAKRYGLRDARAVRVSGAEPAEVYERLGQVAAKLLSEEVTTSDVLGFDSGRTVSRISYHLKTLARCDVVQLAGLVGTVDQNGLDVIRRVCEVSGGTAYPLYAPMIAPDAASAAALRQQPGIVATMEHYRQVTVAIVSVGSWNPPISQVYDRLTPGERSQLHDAGVVADTCALVFTEDGQLLPQLVDRRMAIPVADLRAVPNVIAVAGGEGKAEAIRAVLRSGIVKTLVTDEPTARVLLAAPDRDGS